MVHVKLLTDIHQITSFIKVIGKMRLMGMSYNSYHIVCVQRMLDPSVHILNDNVALISEGSYCHIYFLHLEYEFRGDFLV